MTGRTRWLALSGAVAWALVLFLQSSSSDAGSFLGFLPDGSDKVLHAGAYAVLAGLLTLATGRPLVAVVLATAYGVTDEIFAVELGHRVVRARYAAGLMALPILGWTSGTIVGAVAGEVLPESLSGPMGVLLYAMFTATVVPAVRRSKPVAIVAALAAVASALLYYVPATSGIQAGWRIIIATLAASAIGAWLFPKGTGLDDGAGAEQTDLEVHR